MSTKVKNLVTAQPRLLSLLTAITIGAVGIGLYLALAYAGTDRIQGEVQRIFYLHMASFFGACVAYTVTVVGGVQYLRTREARWDTLSLAGVEVGLALALVNIVTGSVWARPIWETWWNWDPRLTAAAISVLTYAAYLMLRNAIDNIDTRRRFAAVYGIVAIVTVILTFIIPRIVPETIHPIVIGPSPANAEGDFEMSARSGMVLGVNILIWMTLVPVTLMWYRVRLQNFAERVNELRLAVLSGQSS
ncbi:MAG: cytochrome c biogenesis protein CcsA [Anaerolineae bacterium]|jgi:heme exporter protein C|nr:cytochrome c biogenesis protein CcsA [Anaerolineae bacterium]